jgi:hypothetical protein
MLPNTSLDPKDRRVLLKIIEDHGYEKIATKIKMLWGDKVLDDYFSSLIISDRDVPRQGFDPLVFDCILRLYTHHSHDFDFTQESVGFNEVSKRS